MSGGAEAATKLAWLSLALLHLPPAAVLLAPSLARRLYAVDAAGAAGVLVVHRGALFLGVALLALWAVLDPAVRRVAGLVVAASVLGFLLVYARAGLPAGELRTIAVADTVAIVPLAWVVWQSWGASA